MARAFDKIRRLRAWRSGDVVYIGDSVGEFSELIVNGDAAVVSEDIADYEFAPGVGPAGGSLLAFVRHAGGWYAHFYDFRKHPLAFVYGPTTSLSSPRISGDGQAFAFVERSDEASTVHVFGPNNGRHTYPRVDINSLALSPDGQHYAFVAQSAQGGWFVVLDGVPQDKFSEIVGPVFSQNWKRWGYIGVTPTMSRAFVEGMPVGQSAWINDIRVHDTGTFAFVTCSGISDSVFFFGTEYPLGHVLPGTLTLDPTGRHWAVVVVLQFDSEGNQIFEPHLGISDARTVASTSLALVVDGKRVRDIDFVEIALIFAQAAHTSNAATEVGHAIRTQIDGYLRRRFTR